VSCFEAVQLRTFAMFVVLCLYYAVLIIVIKSLYQHGHIAARGTLALQVDFIDSRHTYCRFNDICVNGYKANRV
jgi:hypothetical protein